MANSTNRETELPDWILSPWTLSPWRRLCDILLILAILPLLLALCACVALVVSCTPGGPVLFRQQRVGRNGKVFTILKFRTMLAAPIHAQATLAVNCEQRITRAGRILRRWKLDELPQFVNVLRGEMTLVGPRPRIPEQQTGILPCHPGITGAATLAFAQEEVLLAGLPRHEVDEYCRTVLLPMKHRLDAHYMAEATVASDLLILLRTALRRWPRFATVQARASFDARSSPAAASSWTGSPLASMPCSEPSDPAAA